MSKSELLSLIIGGIGTLFGIGGIILAVIGNRRAKDSDTENKNAHLSVIHILSSISTGLSDLQKEKIAEIIFKKPELFDSIYDEIESIRADEAEADFYRG